MLHGEIPLFLHCMLLSIVKDTLNFFFPRYCWICGRRLSMGESHLCSSCLLDLPRTNYHVRPENSMEQLFWGSFPLVHAVAFFYYHRGSATSEILYLLKYGCCPDIGRYMALVFAQEIQFEEGRGTCSFFADIDFLIPVPLSEEKKKSRGYNQCDAICEGLQQVTHIPICNGLVYRTVSNSTQTRKSRVERALNVEHIFSVDQQKRALLEGKHVLLVDDVCTTGATLKSMAEVLADIPHIRISVLTLGLANSTF